MHHSELSERDWIAWYEAQLRASNVALLEQDESLQEACIAIAETFLQQKEETESWQEYLSWTTVALLKVSRKYRLSYEKLMCQLLERTTRQRDWLHARTTIPWDFLSWERAWYMAEEWEREKVLWCVQHYYGVLIGNSEKDSFRFAFQMLSIHQLLYGGGGWETEEEKEYRWNVLRKRRVIKILWEVAENPYHRKMVLEKARIERLRYASSRKSNLTAQEKKKRMV